MTTVIAVGTQVVYDPENKAYLDSRPVFSRGVINLEKGLKGIVSCIENRGLYRDYMEVEFASGKSVYSHCSYWKKAK